MLNQPVIFKLTHRPSKLLYIGLVAISRKNRTPESQANIQFNSLWRRAFSGKKADQPVQRQMASSLRDEWQIEVLEVCEPGQGRDRKTFWIEENNSYEPHGLNAKAGDERVKSQPCKYRMHASHAGPLADRYRHDINNEDVYRLCVTEGKSISSVAKLYDVDGCCISDRLKTVCLQKTLDAARHARKDSNTVPVPAETLKPEQDHARN